MANLKFRLINFSGKTLEGIPYILEIEDEKEGITITLRILERGLFRYQKNVYTSKEGTDHPHLDSLLKAEEEFGIKLIELSI